MPRAIPRASFRERLTHCSGHLQPPAGQPPTAAADPCTHPKPDPTLRREVRSLARGFAALAGCLLLAIALFNPAQTKAVATTAARTTVHTCADALTAAVHSTARWLVTGALPERPD